MSVDTYSPKNMVLLVNGIQVTGFSDTDLVTITRDEAKFVKYIGVDGGVSRSHNVAEAASAVFSLSQTSSSNGVFSNLIQRDNEDPSGSRTFDMEILDRNSGTYFRGTGCWIENMPEAGYAKEISSREWTVDIAELKWWIFGNDGEGLSNILL